MKKNLLCLLFLGAGVVITSCMQDRDLYHKDDVLKPKEEYFDFNTYQEVSIDVDYGIPNYNPLLEIYIEQPFDEKRQIKEGLEAAYKVYTDSDSSFKGVIKIPAHVQTLYFYSPSKAVYRLKEVKIVNGVAKFHVADEPTDDGEFTSADEAATKATYASTRDDENHINIGGYLTKVDEDLSFYSLYNYYYFSTYNVENSYIKKLYKTLWNSTSISEKSTIGGLIDRLDFALPKRDNSRFISTEKFTNIRTLEETPDGKKSKGAQLDFVYLQNDCSYQNAVAYYYYKTDEVLTQDKLNQLPKFFLFPHLTNGKPYQPVTVRLQFFGEDYSEYGTDLFPPGYTIGWMLVADLDLKTHGRNNWRTLHNEIIKTYEEEQVVYSNQSFNHNHQPGCIALFDRKSGKIVVGFEDQTIHDLSQSDKSYEDVLFYVNANPLEAVIDPEDPDIPIVEDDEKEVLTTQTISGTLAFEDTWPDLGDYDLNDVMVEYTTEITFNQYNQVRKIVDTFKAISPIGSADFENAFGYVIDGKVGTINSAKSTFSVKEEENQIILFDNTKKLEPGTVAKVVREFKSNQLMKRDFHRDYNPFVVIRYQAGVKNRREVHLPKKEMTSWGDKSLIGKKDDAYFIKKDGAYPFAIDIPIASFTPVDEKHCIGNKDEYPDFNLWANSKGKSHRDWYLSKVK